MLTRRFLGISSLTLGPVRGPRRTPFSRRDLSACCGSFEEESGPASRANEGFMSKGGSVVTGQGAVVSKALRPLARGRAVREEEPRVDKP